MVFTECGISAIIHKNTRPDHIILKSLRDLQHRGREAFGVSYMNTYGKIIVKKKPGMVTEMEELNSISVYCFLEGIRNNNRHLQEFFNCAGIFFEFSWPHNPPIIGIDERDVP